MHKCKNNIGSYQCSCRAGYKSNGNDCDQIMLQKILKNSPSGQGLISFIEYSTYIEIKHNLCYLNLYLKSVLILANYYIKNDENYQGVKLILTERIFVNV